MDCLKLEKLESYDADKEDQTIGNWVIRITHDAYAWAITHQGIWITKDGTVYKYDGTTKKYPTWPDKVKSSTKVGKIDPKTWKKWVDCFKSIKKGNIIEQPLVGADAGQTDVDIQASNGIFLLSTTGDKTGYVDDPSSIQLSKQMTKMFENFFYKKQVFEHPQS